MNDEPKLARRFFESFLGPLTLEGFTLLVLSFLLPTLAFAPRGSLTFYFALILLSVLLVSRFASTWALRGLMLERHAPERASVDRTFRVSLSLTNRHRTRPLGPVRIDDGIEGSRAARNASVIAVVGAREQVVTQYRLTIRRRGDHRFSPALLTSTYPFGLHRVRRRLTVENRILVRPRLGTLMPFFFEEAERHHKRVLRTRSSRTEEDFRGLREYRQGDNPRWIHWKRSARLQKIYVKEFEQPQSRRYLVLLSTHPTSSDRRDRLPIESAISFVATLLQESLRRGHQATLAFADEQPTILEMPPHPSHFDKALDALARVGFADRPTLDEVVARLPPEAIREALVICLRPEGGEVLGTRSHALLQTATAIWELEVPSKAFSNAFRLEPRWPYASAMAALDPEAFDA